MSMATSTGEVNILSNKKNLPKVKDPEDFIEHYEELIENTEIEIKRRSERVKSGESGDPDWDKEAILRGKKEIRIYQSRLGYWRHYMRRHTD